MKELIHLLPNIKSIFMKKIIINDHKIRKKSQGCGLCSDIDREVPRQWGFANPKAKRVSKHIHNFHIPQPTLTNER